MGMPELKPIDAILSSNDAIGAAFPTSEPVDSCPREFSLIISSESLDIIADRVKIILALTIIHVGHAKSKLAHAEPIGVVFSGAITKAGLGILQADLSEFWGKPRLTLPKRGKAWHIELHTVSNRFSEVTMVGKSNSGVESVILQDVGVTRWLASLTTSSENCGRTLRPA